MSTLKRDGASSILNEKLFQGQGMFLNPEAGANLRLVSVITRASFDPDPLYSGTKLCDRKTCDVCIQVCPSGALNRDEAVSFQIDGRRVEYCRKDKWRCRWANRGLLKTTLGKAEVPIPDQVKPEDYLRALELQDPWQSAELNMVGTASICGLCQALFTFSAKSVQSSKVMLQPNKM